jgi:formylglycine-generating enzyme required for sulfatase activity
MKTWMGLFLTVLMMGSANQASAQNNSKSPSLKVVCSVLAADITLTVHLPEGDKVAPIGTSPVKLKQGQRYTLLISKDGYVPYKNSFLASWNNQKEKNVVLEKGIAPNTKKEWIVDLEDSVTMEFIPIPTGEFMMGSNEGEEDEQPVHKVAFSRPFWMAKTEVTQQQYGQFQPAPKVLKGKDVPMPMGAELPVCGVSWNDAKAFCGWLTTNERMNGRLPEGYEYTLPTEAEWEYACRAGSTGEFSEKIDSMGWYNKNSSEKTNPVGLKNPNDWGLHDMHGNVWEWCIDSWYANYEHAPTDGSQRGLASDEYTVDRTKWDEKGNTYRLRNGGYRVVRGGSWHYSARACRSANRYYHTPDYKLNYLGFRVVLIWNPPTMSMEVTRRIKAAQ